MGAAKSAKSLGMLLTSPASKVATIESKLSTLDRNVKLLSNAGRLVRESAGYSETLSSLISEVENTYSYLQLEMQDSKNKDSYESVLESYYTTLKQLMEQKKAELIALLGEPADH